MTLLPLYVLCIGAADGSASHCVMCQSFGVLSGEQLKQLTGAALF